MKLFPFIAALLAFLLAAIIFACALFATLLPNEFDRRVEWVQLKVQALLPSAPHPEFVPTPLIQAEVPTPLPIVAANSAQAGVTPTRPASTPTRKPTSAPAGGVTPTLPPRVALTNFRHDYQRFNNCGPATLSILLSHSGRTETQYDLAPILKGSKDDKNVSPDEIAALARSYGFRVTVRVNGDIAEMKQFLARGIPVMVENWFVPREKDASGHYRLLTGYDDTGSASTRGVGLSVEFGGNYAATEDGFFIAQDSYEGPNIKLPYRAWDLDWRVFNRTYIVLYTDAQAATVKAIVGDETDDATMYAHARDTAQREIAANESDAIGWFNLGSSFVGLGKYADAARAFDKARVLKLPWRMMWYQFGPYEAYLRTGRNAEVIALANATLANMPALEESLYYRGRAQLALGQNDAARESFKLAAQANPRFEKAQQALMELGN
ncbi:MAG: C39 family peptidase [Chloroflexi bacterium]|nr:C39 family peptidase [Chloroflexota bacterium]